MQPARQTDLDALDVLTRAGASRERVSSELGEQLDDVDAALVGDVLRASGRVGETLQLRRSLVQLCALVRAVDAAEQQLITLDDLASGLALHAARSDRFEHFDDARVLLRTLAELLARDTPDSGRQALRSQVAILHRQLREFLLEQLTGSADGSMPTGAADTLEIADPRAAFVVSDPVAVRRNHELVHELLHGADDHPVTGILGAAWRRGWSAVPIVGELPGESDADEPARLADALELLDPAPHELVQVDLRSQPRWHLDGTTMRVSDGLRRSWHLPPTLHGLQLATTERPSWCVLTTSDLQFAIVEGAGHHALLGPTAFVTAACAAPPLETVARFREHVEQLAGGEHDDPPADLLEIATRFGRLRRRSR
jgi:hypothetical protein